MSEEVLGLHQVNNIRLLPHSLPEGHLTIAQSRFCLGHGDYVEGDMKTVSTRATFFEIPKVWESLEVVQRYTRPVTFEDSLRFYKAPLA